MKICFVGGMGRLGYPMAVWTACSGLPTTIADVNAEAIQAFKDGTFTSPEPGMNDLAGSRDFFSSVSLTATADVYSAVKQAELTIVLVPSPSHPDGSFSIEHVLDACGEIGLALENSDEYKVISISTTVNPGDTEGQIRQELEFASGKKAHRDFGLVHCPEFVRRGYIIRDFSRPEYVVIGCDNGLEMYVMEHYYRQITQNATHFHIMSVPSAEIAKIGLNVAVTSKIARANEIAWLCHETPGADALSVLAAIGTDSRIGSKFFSAGPPPGGPCFPRDNRSFSAAMMKRGLRAYLAEATGQHEKWHTWQIAILAMEYAPPVMPRIGILGLAYKPDVADDVGSPGLDLMQIFDKKNITVRAYDPEVKTDVTVSSLDELVNNSDVLVLMTCWPEFRRLATMDLEDKTVIDVWGFLGGLESGQYVRFGRGDNTDG